MKKRILWKLGKKCSEYPTNNSAFSIYALRVDSYNELQILGNVVEALGRYYSRNPSGERDACLNMGDCWTSGSKRSL